MLLSVLRKGAYQRFDPDDCLESDVPGRFSCAARLDASRGAGSVSAGELEVASEFGPRRIADMASESVDATSSPRTAHVLQRRRAPCACGVALLLFQAVLCATLFGPASATDGRKVALVVGNAAYEKVSALSNPKRDAADFADRLRDLGFDVTELFDGDRFSLDRMADRFVASAKNADLALFYFAGHGVQLFDQNFLLARDADPGALKKAGDLGLGLTDFAARLRHSGAVRVAMLIDACRDNPLPMDATIRLLTQSGEAPKTAEAKARSTTGLASFEAPRAGPAGNEAEMLTFFAAQPGRVSYDGSGANSYFMEGLKEASSKRDRPLSDVFRAASLYVRTVTKGDQVPQVVSDWTADIGLGAVTAAKVEFLSSGTPFTPAEQALLNKAAGRSFQKLRGEFIAVARWGLFLTDDWDEQELAKAKALHQRSYATRLTYDLDRDGNDESITVYNEVNVVQVVVEKEGVRATIANCSLPNEIDRIDVALKDINGDRRPEILIDYDLAEPVDGSFGRFCILDFTGFKNLAELRRGNTGRFDAGESLFRTLLMTGTGRTVTLTHDGTIRTCNGTGCPDVVEFGYVDGRFTLRENYGTKPSGGAALPFADEGERAQNLRRTASVKAAPSLRAFPAIESRSSSGSAATTEESVARFIEATLFRPGPQPIEQLRALYDAQVDYFGKPRVALRQVLTDKDRYFKNWPERDFRLDRSTLAVKEAAGLIDVSFGYSFQVSGARGARSGKGIATFRLRSAGNGRYVIMSEGGRTL